MTDISLNRFDVVTVLKRNYSVSMSHIVEANFRNSKLLYDFFEILVYGMMTQMTTNLVGKYQIPVITPDPPCTKMLFFLLNPLLTENIHYEGRRGNSTHFISFATNEAIFSAFLFFFLKLL